MLPAPPRVRVPLAVLLGGAVLAACSGTAVDEAPTTNDDERIAAIVAAREQVVEPAQALGTAAADVTAALDVLVARPEPATRDRLRAAATDLASTIESVDALELGDETDELQAAEDALDEAAGAATTLRGAVDEVVESAEQAAALDEHLDAWVAAWDEAGSRSQLLARFDEVAAEARTLADTPVGSAPTSCTGPVEARLQAATFVAEATEDLRGFVDVRDGNGFDARRAELAEAPFGHDDAGVVRGPDASIDPATCPAVEEAEDAATDVAASLRALQKSLNPADLAG